jgi:uncharacterized protein YndB with AHSA1/START domain
MPIKRDEAGKRWVEMEFLAPGTPEQLWSALATGPGNAAWFVRAEIEGRVGGKLVFDFGHGNTSAGEVTAWDPPSHFGYVERDWEPGAPPVATEITIVGRSGDRCVVRMVHSLFASTEAWDDQVEGFEAGWPGFFVVLRSYLRHFAGEEAASFIASAKAKGDALTSWLTLGEALGLAGANVGERRSAPSGPERWSAKVEHVHQDATQRYLLLHVDGDSPGLVLLGTHDRAGVTTVSVCRYFYGESADARAAASEPLWRKWLDQTFGDGTAPDATP